MNFRSAILAAGEAVHGLSLTEYVAIADLLSQHTKDAPDFSTHEGLVEYTKGHLTAFADRKIACIKELRQAASTATGITPGLLECKNAVEAAFPFQYTPPVRENGFDRFQTSSYSDPWADSYDRDEPPF